MNSNVLSLFLGATAVSMGQLASVSQNPIHSLLLLIGLFMSGSVLLAQIHLEYLALVFFIVYVGAIVVLFLFLIMMMEMKLVSANYRFSELISAKAGILNVLSILVIMIIMAAESQGAAVQASLGEAGVVPSMSVESIDWARFSNSSDMLRAIGGVLFTEFASSLILASVVLFVSMVGAVVVTMPVQSHLDASVDEKLEIQHLTIKFQDPNLQATRHPLFSIHSSL